MKIKYFDLIDQTFEFPQREFSLNQEELLFHDIPMMDLVEQYGTPLKFTYLPSISSQIQKAKSWFDMAMSKVNYSGKYHYCYCTKSSHFEPVLTEALKNDIHIETSSAFDIDIVKKLVSDGKLKKNNYVVCNGYKTDAYLENIASLIHSGYKNVIPVIDNTLELDKLSNSLNPEEQLEIGIRIASEEEPKFAFYTSRLGIGYKDIVPFYEQKVQSNKQVELKMLHFFINTGIRDTAYYWSELSKCLGVYVKLKKVCPTLTALNIGGGFPIKNSLNFNFDYAHMVEEIVRQVKTYCAEHNVPEPDLFTEFGSFTVGESGGAIYKILHQKPQNDREKWNMIDSSFMTNLPDSWAINKRFVMLPVNRWNDEYERVFLGGLTCDSDDYYNSEQHVNAIYLPKYDVRKPLYIGFFNTGAYQESVGGYGGIQHCLTPAPKHIIIQRNEDGSWRSELFAPEQSPESMLRILGYQ